MQGPGRIELVKQPGNDPWSTFTVAHAQSPAGEPITKAWLNIETSQGRFSDPANRQIRSIINDQSFAIDVDGDDQLERVQLSKTSLRCFRGDIMVYETELDQPVTFDRIHTLIEGNPLIGLSLGDEQFYALFDLADGRRLFQSDMPGDDHAIDKHRLSLTPLVQSSNGNLNLVRTTHEGIRSYSIHRTGPKVEFSTLAATFPIRTDPRVTTRLPVSILWGGQSLSGMSRSMFQGILLTLMALILPVAYLVRLVHRGQWTLSYLLLAPFVAILAILAWKFLLDPSRTLSIDPNASEPWPFVLIGGCIGVAAIAFLLRSIRDREYLILAIPLVLATLMTIIVIQVGTLAAAQSRGIDWQYNWRIEDVFLLLIVFSMNLMMFAYFLRVGFAALAWLLRRSADARTTTS